MLHKHMYSQMVLIRIFEEKVEELFSKGELFGTTHGCIGQEAVAVGVINAISKNDIVTSNHRGHGHFIAFTENIEGLMAEIMGKETGVCAGRGGSQHLYYGNFYSNGITGGMTATATGMAMAEKFMQSRKIVVCFIGDGALGQGIVYESLNIASLWKLPILYVVENNSYAMSTHIRQNLAGTIQARIGAFGIDSKIITSNNVTKIFEAASLLTNQIRKGYCPKVLVCNTYRLCGHSKSDDMSYRTREEEESWRRKDPLTIAGNQLSQGVKNQIIKKVDKRIKEAVLKAQNASFSKLASLREI